ncbi:omega-amidase NIT2-like [Phlebotomus argentipes]|uniref:omega-amidase NIT2-like n=1 Tax=Phlebotomus argentipes TaxID=94469 RepID=UPI002892FC23|nr:omega-amidase NIT2-like [Phlebotomus argentipes]
MSSSKLIRLILVQHKVGDVKEDNVARAVSMVKSAVAKEKKSSVPILVVLPECFNSPYGVKFFDKYAETIPDGYTSKALSGLAKELGIYLVAGSFPERDAQNPKTLYNACTVWNPKGELIAKHRKVHLFDVDIPNGITFKESDGFTPGKQFTIVDVGPARIGIGICYDIQFEEFARIYRNEGCNLLIYPASFSLTTGPLSWELYQRSRANDTQSFVTMVSNARDYANDYVAWGHTMLVDPWGQVVKSLNEDEGFIATDVDFTICDQVREQIPVINQRRTDLYDIVVKIPIK